jgi:uncharacterized protein
LLVSVHAGNADEPLELYRYLRGLFKETHIQLIPIVERAVTDPRTGQVTVSPRSVTPEQWGRLLTSIFDEWVTRDVGTTFVQSFDVALAAWVDAPPLLCVFAPTCGNALVMEHNGDLYSCDHFVTPEHLLGNILLSPLSTLATSEKQRAFGENKQRLLPEACRQCRYLFACHGECPANRFPTHHSDEPNLNYLCGGYKVFFSHVEPAMRAMAELVLRGRAAAEIMMMPRETWAKERSKSTLCLANDPCPCGSGFAFKRCHGTYNTQL